MKTLTIIKPDDWHLHLREGLVLKNIIHFTSEFFGRAIVMPNTKTPITSIDRAISYKKSIVKALPESSRFEPLMTIYLTDDTDKVELRLKLFLLLEIKNHSYLGFYLDNKKFLKLVNNYPRISINYCQF